jgi:threonine dehydrogenase-like Zn-dependent dehydrogenase
MQTCRAVVFVGGDVCEVREFPVPDPPSAGAVIKVEAVGMCGSDLTQFHGVDQLGGAGVFPVVPGHETVGRIAKLGAQARFAVQEGDRVAVDEVFSKSPMRVYGYCDMTGEGRLGLWGGYGEYMEILAGTTLHKLSEKYPAEQLTLFEPLANAVNWAGRVNVAEGDVVVVQGPGHQGLAVLEAVLARSPSMVIHTGLSNDTLRLKTATSLGADHTIVVDVDDPVQVVADLTDGRMADVVMDIAPTPETVPLALELARSEGRVLLAGLKHFSAIPGLVTDWLVLKALTVVGGSGFTVASMAKAIEMIESGEARSDLVVGEVLSIDRIDEAMGLLSRTIPDRDAVRVGLRHSA